MPHFLSQARLKTVIYLTGAIRLTMLGLTPEGFQRSQGSLQRLVAEDFFSAGRDTHRMGLDVALALSGVEPSSLGTRTPLHKTQETVSRL